ncbi:MAG TPA: DEAD/DEAH box helicase, partial [Planctomycetes bacterium]|nr:DEAD/DEAH box helicase [Planctomycetota bacterium]
QTGTGKTAAFLLPILQHLDANEPAKGRRKIRALVLTPTRELAAQISESASSYGRHLHLRHTVIFGGVNERTQIKALRAGLDLLVTTPGRLLDLHGRDHIDFRDVEHFVLDEADRMLDMGFIHDVKRVLKVMPRDRQNLLFSATMPSTIVELAGSFLHEPVSVSVAPTVKAVERIEQSVILVDRKQKRTILLELLEGEDVESVIVFTRTKHGANRLSKQLTKAGVESAPIHGNKSQNARTRALEGFRSGEIRVLVATDLAARGIDVEGISHVINYELPNEPATYVHRIGRTARAGREGVAIALVDPSEERDLLRDVERFTKKRLVRVGVDGVPEAEQPAPVEETEPRGGGRPSGHTGGSKSRGRGGRGRSRRRSGGGLRASTGKASAGSQGGAPRSQSGASRSQGGSSRSQSGASRSQGGSSRSQSGGSRSQGGSSRAEGGPATPSFGGGRRRRRGGRGRGSQS